MRQAEPHPSWGVGYHVRSSHRHLDPQLLTISQQMADEGSRNGRKRQLLTEHGRAGDRGRTDDLVLGKETNPGHHTIANHPTRATTGIGSSSANRRMVRDGNPFRYTPGTHEV
jgi:hypothetical protein